MSHRILYGTAPAAGAEISFVFPGGYVWQLLSVNVTLVTDPTVIARQPTLVIDDGTTNTVIVPPNDAQGPNVNGSFCWLASISYSIASAGNIDHMNAIPAGLYLPAGWRVRTMTDDLQAADQWGAPLVWCDDGLADPTVVLGTGSDAPAPPRLVIP